MTGNPLPWIVIAGVVLGSLVLKGYIKLPKIGQAPATTPKPPQAVNRAYESELETLPSHVLGFYFAQAKRREVEIQVAERVAQEAAKQIEETFANPFSPAPAGQSNAGPK